MLTIYYSANALWQQITTTATQSNPVVSAGQMTFQLQQAIEEAPIPGLTDVFHDHFTALQLAETATPEDRLAIYMALASHAQAMEGILKTKAQGTPLPPVLDNQRIRKIIRHLSPSKVHPPSDDKALPEAPLRSDGDHGWGPYGITLRDYQRSQVQRVIDAIDAGKDRGLLRAPTQTGKTLIIGPLMLRTATRFPGKMTLVISPSRIITRQVIDDLKLTAPAMRVGIFDAQRKDVKEEYDVIIASAYTLGREEHLAKFIPDFFGLIIVDEATYSLAKTWRRILEHFGFLGPRGGITKVEGRFLLGLTADPFSLKKTFGEGNVIPSFGIRWFMEHGYLHRIVGLQERYAPDMNTELVEQAEELFLW